MVQIVTNSNGGGGGNKNAVIGPSSAVDGDIVIFDGDTGKIIKDSGEKLSNFQVKWIEVNVATAAGTAAKVGTTTDGDYTPTKGDFLLVNFVSGCNVDNPTLNIDGSGAKNIRTGNVNANKTTFALGATANSNIKALLYYDGTYYRCWSTTNSNTTYSAMSVAEGKTGTATSSRAMRADYLKQIIKYHAVSDTAYDSTWDGVTSIAPSKNAVYDKIETVVGSIPTDNAQLANGCSYVTSGDLPDFSGYQLTCNLVTSLSGADDTHYPSAKAVADAITSAGGGDMLKSVYDPNNCAKDAFNYNNMYNKPTIPTNNNQLTNGCGYTTCTGTLTASNISDAAYGSSWNGVTTVAPSKNAVYDKIESVISSIPTNNNQLSNGCGYTTCTGTLVASDLTPYAKSVDLATVATSGKYCDLTGQPTIGAATLTIQKNGTTVNTFGANATSNVTANITVPTDTGDLTNGAGFITGITSSDVTSALGYTPYNSTNPAGYTTCTGTLTQSAISDTAFGASWDADTTHAPSKNAIYDVLGDVETLLANL